MISKHLFAFDLSVCVCVSHPLLGEEKSLLIDGMESKCLFTCDDIIRQIIRSSTVRIVAA